MFDETDIAFLKRRGVEDAEDLILTARQVEALLAEEHFEAAKRLIDTITEPALREALELAYEFCTTSRCIKPE